MAKEKQEPNIAWNIRNILINHGEEKFVNLFTEKDIKKGYKDYKKRLNWKTALPEYKKQKYG